MFKCTYGACISKTDKCNGIKNCADNSDEEGCPSTSVGIPTVTVKPPRPISTSTVTNNNKK